MANFELPKVAERRLKAEDFKSEAFRRDAADREQGEQGEGHVDAARNVNLQRLAEQLERHPIDEIAALIRALTYGEMIELAEGLWTAQRDGSDVSKDSLPGVLHRWSTSRTRE
jgi:hypothetical protein